jgi:hypothetical protein
LVAGLQNHYNTAKCEDGGIDQHCTNTSKHVRDPSVTPIGGIKAPPPKPDPDRQEWRSEQDLQAQWDMAKWAFFSAIAAFMGFAATVVGIFYVRQTLEANRAAVDEARKGIAVAQASVAVAKRTAKRELRAYVSVTPENFGGFQPGSHAVVTWIVKNHGQTPAFKIKHTYKLGVFPNALPPGFRFPVADTIIPNEFSLFPGAEVPSWFRHDEVLTAQDVADIRADTKRFHCWGVTEYQDAFQENRYTNFSASAGGQYFADSMEAYIAGRPYNGPRWSWSWGKGHNEAT